MVQSSQGQETISVNVYPHTLFKPVQPSVKVDSGPVVIEYAGDNSHQLYKGLLSCKIDTHIIKACLIDYRTNATTVTVPSQYLTEKQHSLWLTYNRTQVVSLPVNIHNERAHDDARFSVSPLLTTCETSPIRL
jgi:hypothetical protein